MFHLVAGKLDQGDWDDSRGIEGVGREYRYKKEEEAGIVQYDDSRLRWQSDCHLAPGTPNRFLRDKGRHPGFDRIECCYPSERRMKQRKSRSGG